jgi:DNA-binding transcriptional LysR family regulator
MFSLKQLKVFDAIARLGSVSEAAEELAMTQPAASMSLQQLESELGAELFIRARKRLVLSERGKLLQPMARSLLVEAREIMATMNSETHSPEIRIGASPTVGGYLLNDICATYMREHPDVRLSIAVLPAFEVINRVDEMALDVGIIEFITARPTLEMLRWREDALTVFCAPEHPLATAKRLKASELQGERWCLQHRFSDTRRQFTLALLERIPTMDIVLESDSLAILRNAVRANIGLGCLPRPCIAHALKTGELVELPIHDLSLGIPITIVSRKSVRHSSYHTQFVQTVLAH